MGREIERKFLVIGNEWRHLAHTSLGYRQGYLANNECCSVRIRLENDNARLNIKSATLGVARHEFDYPVPLAEAQEIFEHLCGPRTIEKTRHLVRDNGHLWEIDEFHGANQGLVVAELELQSETESFNKPSWIGQEVSDDPRYYNVRLIDHPFCEWQ
jgi:adenylate cyclase